MAYAQLQPKDGDSILHCGHIDQKKIEWSYLPDGSEFVRPDGSRGFTHWIAECLSCREARGNDDPVIRGDGIWKGDAPIIKEVPLEDRPKPVRGW